MLYHNKYYALFVGLMQLAGQMPLSTEGDKSTGKQTDKQPDSTAGSRETGAISLVAGNQDSKMTGAISQVAGGQDSKMVGSISQAIKRQKAKPR